MSMVPVFAPVPMTDDVDPDERWTLGTFTPPPVAKVPYCGTISSEATPGPASAALLRLNTATAFAPRSDPRDGSKRERRTPLVWTPDRAERTADDPPARFPFEHPERTWGNGGGRLSRDLRRIAYAEAMIETVHDCHDCGRRIEVHAVKSHSRPTLAIRGGTWTLICRDCNGGALDPRDGLPQRPDVRGARQRERKASTAGMVPGEGSEL